MHPGRFTFLVISAYCRSQHIAVIPMPQENSLPLFGSMHLKGSLPRMG